MDLNIRMPRAFAPLEERVKALVGAAVSRGKVDVYIGVEHLNGECVRLSLNREYLEGYLAVLGQVGKEYGISGEVTLDMVAARSEGVLARKAEEDAEKVWPLMERAAREALDAFAAMRGAEGERLRADLLARLGVLRGDCGGWTPLRPRQCARPTRRCSPACREPLSGVTPDESRLLTECAVFADKTDVTEELVRLSSHFGQFETMLGEDAPVGRKCDFLVQEINREINTIGCSKCCGTEMTNLVITAKSELEKIRSRFRIWEASPRRRQRPGQPERRPAGGGGKRTSRDSGRSCRPARRCTPRTGARRRRFRRAAKPANRLRGSCYAVSA